MKDSEIAAWNEAFGKIEIPKGPPPEQSPIVEIAAAAREMADDYNMIGNADADWMARAWRKFADKLDPQDD